MGASVWLHVVDLREPLNNGLSYAQGRADTRTVTGTDGRFHIPFEGRVLAVGADAPGYHMTRGEPGETITLRPADTAVVAHRGASFYAPENTLAAIDKAAWLGADWVELDVRLTRDGRLVITHDAATGRVAPTDLVVANATWPMLRDLDVGSWFHPSFASSRIPTLSAALQQAQLRDLQVILDVKAPKDRAPATREALADLLIGSPWEDRVVVAAFRQATVRHCVDAGLRCAYIGNGTLLAGETLERTVALGAGYLLINHTAIVPGLREEATAHGVLVFAWTVNDPLDWDALAGEVDGIITDRPSYYLDP